MQLGVTYYQAKQGLVANLIARAQFRREVMRLASKHGIKGFTLLKALGAWEGKTEPSYQILIEGASERSVKGLARDLRDRFKQDAVMFKHGEAVEFV